MMSISLEVAMQLFLMMIVMLTGTSNIIKQYTKKA